MKQQLILIVLATFAIGTLAAQAAAPSGGQTHAALPSSQDAPAGKAATRHLSDKERAVLREQLYQFSRRTAKGS